MTKDRPALRPQAKVGRARRRAQAPRIEKRQALRFDKVFPVVIESRDYGIQPCIARNVSNGGMFLEIRDPLPLGSTIRVRFAVPDSAAEVVARAEVKNHYFLNYNDPSGPRLLSGMAVRFLGFDEDGRELLQLSLTRFRVLH
jgi:hypothetical protein